MDYIHNFYSKYKATIPKNREEDFQMATIQAIEKVYTKLEEIEKKIKHLEK